MSHIEADDPRWCDESEIESYSPDMYDFVFNDDYSKFIPLKLRWYDDLSYIAYQCNDLDD